eukprot:scaffold12224_cov82-Skeletonema_dohrnii-CCMP3373.AAC.2
MAKSVAEGRGDGGAKLANRGELSIDNCNEAAPFEEKRFEPERNGSFTQEGRMCLSRPLLYLDFSRTSPVSFDSTQHTTKLIYYYTSYNTTSIGLS